MASLHDHYETILQLAEPQGFAVTRVQLIAAGIPARSIARLATRWTAPWNGVYVLSSSSFHRVAWLTQAWAAALAGGEFGRLTGHAALYAHGVLDRPPSQIKVLTTAARVNAHPWITFQRSPSGRCVQGRRHSVPCVRPEEALLAACADSREHEVVGLVTDACQRRATNAAALADALQRTPRVKHRRLITLALHSVVDGCESTLEYDYRTNVVRRHGLPQGILQRRTGLSTRADQAYEDFGLLVELDGQLGHVGSGAFRDAMRDNHSTLAGWRTLRFGWHDVASDPCAIARIVARALKLGSWKGNLSPCPRCPPDR